MYARKVTAGTVGIVLLAGLSSFLLGGEVIIKGSDTMLVMNQELAQAYMKEFPGSDIQVSGGGSGVGIAALHDNTTDVAACSRDLKPAEIEDFLYDAGMRPVSYSAAMDGIAIFVNVDNPVSVLTVDQLRKIFHGDYKSWSDVGGPKKPINIYSRDNTSGTYSFIKDEVLDGDDYTSSAETLPGTAAVYNAVSKDSKGIGYGGIGYNKGVKVLKLKADEGAPAYLPTKASVYDRTYPLSRTLNYYLNPRSTNDEAVKFIKWVRSPEGQKIVVKSSYFALPEMIQFTEGVVGTEDLNAHGASREDQAETKRMEQNGKTISVSTVVLPKPKEKLSSNGAMDKDSPSTSMAIPIPKPVSDSTAYQDSTKLDSAPVNFTQESLAKREANLSDAENKIAAVETKLADREAKLDELEAKLAEREAALAAQEARLREWELEHEATKTAQNKNSDQVQSK